MCGEGVVGYSNIVVGAVYVVIVAGQTFCFGGTFSSTNTNGYLYSNCSGVNGLGGLGGSLTRVIVRNGGLTL